MLLEIILFLIILIAILVYLIGWLNQKYWTKRGVAFYAKNKVIGPYWEFLTQDKAMFEIFHDLYKQHPNEPAVGMGLLLTPTLYVKDLKNIQHMMQSDFQSFNNRGVEYIEKDVLADNVMFMQGEKWKLMRQIITPLFTATKLKNMYYIIDKSAHDFVEYLRSNPDKWKGNAFDTLNKCCSASIGAVAFGVGRDSTFDSPFLRIAREALAPTLKVNVKQALAASCPMLFKALRLKLFLEQEEFFVQAIKTCIRQREMEKVKKYDYADLCVSLKQTGKLKDPDTGFELEPTDELLAAQLFSFVIAGVEPCATAIFCTLVELSKHPSILQRVHKEVDETFEKYNGQLSYDAITEMAYLDKILNESLRFNPPVGFLTRRCIKDTVLPVGNIKVEKGTMVFTSLYEVHHDPNYFHEPEKFDPERFSNDSTGGGGEGWIHAFWIWR